MSHELRTPLNAVLGFSQLLRSEPGHVLNEEQRDRAAQIEHAGQHLLAMIDRVLDLSGSKPGTRRLRASRCALGPIIERTLVQLAAEAEEAGVSLGYTPPPLALHARADATRLQQVLGQLLSNGIKFNRRAGSVHVLCREEGDMVRISVSDTGPGLTREQRAHLFEPFNRLGAEKTAIKGAGMGLAIAHKLVTLMEGRIDVETQPGAGAAFSVCCRRRSHARQRSGKRARLNPTPLSVLYAEDNELNVELMRQVLQLRPGCVLRVARNGAEAIRNRAQRNARPAAARHAPGRHERLRRGQRARARSGDRARAAHRVVVGRSAGAYARRAHARLLRLSDEAARRGDVPALPRRATRSRRAVNGST